MYIQLTFVKCIGSVFLPIDPLMLFGYRHYDHRKCPISFTTIAIVQLGLDVTPESNPISDLFFYPTKHKAVFKPFIACWLQDHRKLLLTAEGLKATNSPLHSNFP